MHRIRDTQKELSDERKKNIETLKIRFVANSVLSYEADARDYVQRIARANQKTYLPNGRLFTEAYFEEKLNLCLYRNYRDIRMSNTYIDREKVNTTEFDKIMDLYLSSCIQLLQDYVGNSYNQVYDLKTTEEDLENSKAMANMIDKWSNKESASDKEKESYASKIFRKYASKIFRKVEELESARDTQLRILGIATLQKDKLEAKLINAGFSFDYGYNEKEKVPTFIINIEDMDEAKKKMFLELLSFEKQYQQEALKNKDKVKHLDNVEKRAYALFLDRLENGELIAKDGHSLTREEYENEVFVDGFYAQYKNTRLSERYSQIQDMSNEDWLSFSDDYIKRLINGYIELQGTIDYLREILLNPESLTEEMKCQYDYKLGFEVLQKVAFEEKLESLGYQLVIPSDDSQSRDWQQPENKDAQVKFVQELEARYQSESMNTSAVVQ